MEVISYLSKFEIELTSTGIYSDRQYHVLTNSLSYGRLSTRIVTGRLWLFHKLYFLRLNVFCNRVTFLRSTNI